MASDQDYMSFLDKANEDPSKGVQKQSGSGSDNKKKKAFRTTQEGVDVPTPLARVCERGAFYTSDADEPFEAVALRWDEGGRGLPDEGMSFIFSSSSCFGCRAFLFGVVRA
jgi:hypothetical protein